MNKYDKYIPIKDFDPRAYPNCQKVFFLLKNTDASFTGFIYSKNSHYYVKSKRIGIHVLPQKN